MIKAKAWKGGDLSGNWTVTRKIDGVRVIIKDGVAMSRHNKPLYNIPPMPDGDYEAHTGDFRETIEIVRAYKSERRMLDPSEMYSLDPLDLRLLGGYKLDPTEKFILVNLDRVNQQGDEGLVLRQGDVWLKVKPKPTADVFVTGYQPGEGKHAGRMGALLTAYGKVGTGFTDAERTAFSAIEDDIGVHGMLIEVEYMGMTSGGKFRHPRFVRIREDKTEESLS